MGQLSDKDIDKLIAKAGKASDVAKEVEALRRVTETLAKERGPGDPAIGRVWATMTDLVCDHDVPKLRPGVLEGAAMWLETHVGAAHRQTLRAWAEMGGAAREDEDWPNATKAWTKIVEMELADPRRADLLLVSSALRGLGARRLADKEPTAAVALFERDLGLREEVHGEGSRVIKISVENLARALAEAGDTARSEVIQARVAGLS